jgi:hypothetical protein
MDQRQQLSIFRAQTVNVRELESAWRHLNRHINSLLISKNPVSVDVLTKLLAIVYCALAESVFSRLVHTPHGLEPSEIDHVKAIAGAQGVKVGWIKCAELALERVDAARSNHGHNVRKRLTQLIDEYIFDPSLIRNKLAHGQWHTALNREGTAENQELTSEIRGLTVVDLYRQKHALVKLSQIVEDIIESPNKAHMRDYWAHLTELEEQQREMKSWTMQRKIDRLHEKRSFAQDAG